MPSVGFEHTIPMFGLEKTVHDLDRAVTEIGVMEIVNQYVERFVKFLEFGICLAFCSIDSINNKIF
jgi:hypothetical protein